MSVSEATYRSFVSVEHLEEVTRRLGWLTEYRQVEPGINSSKVAELADDYWFLMGEQSSRAVEVQAPAPTGMFALALVEGRPGVLNGQNLHSNHIFFLGPDADFRVVLPGGVKVTQVGVAVHQFEELTHAVLPDISLPLEGSSLIATVPGRLEQTRRVMNVTLSTPPGGVNVREEAVAAIVTDLVAAMAEHDSAKIERSLHSAAAQRALGRAREYIEAHLSETLRVASICNYAGTTLRSLNRVFSRELGMSPQEYVKARRLNAVRRQLLEADIETDVRVTEVAMQQGFTHLGRFSGEYRRYFGESPRVTLQTR